MPHREDEASMAFLHKLVNQFRVLQIGSLLYLIQRDMGQFNRFHDIIGEMMVEPALQLTPLSLGFIRERGGYITAHYFYPVSGYLIDKDI